MIKGIIAYPMDEVDRLEVLESYEDVSCFTFDNGIPFDEVITIPISISVGDSPTEENRIFDEIIKLVKSGDLELY